MSPTWSTISTTQRHLQWSSSRSNPATGCLCSSMTRSSVTRPSAKRHLHHSGARRTSEPLTSLSLFWKVSLSVRHGSTVRPVNELSSLGSSSREGASLGMEELQKSHVLKVKELSRRKLTEDFIEVTSFFQSLNVKTVYILGDNNAKSQMLGLTTSTSGIRWLHHYTFNSEKQARDCCRFITRKRDSLLQRAQSIFSRYRKSVNWLSQKRKSNQELENCQFRIILDWEQEQLLADAKSEILRHDYRADVAENNIW